MNEQTDGRTNRQTDRSREQVRAPKKKQGKKEEGMGREKEKGRANGAIKKNQQEEG